MSLDLNVLTARIEETFHDAKVQITDIRGDGKYYNVCIESPVFEGMEIVDQHRLVYDNLKDIITDDMQEDISLKTAVPEGKKVYGSA